MTDVLNKLELKQVLSEIDSDENRVRKYLAYKELDIYNQNQAKYIDAKINQIYGSEACNNIQTITSINLATRIVSAEASIYKKAPARTFANASEKEVEHIGKLYESICVDEKLKTANRLYKLGSQSALMMVPDAVSGSLKVRPLYKHQYDVVPSESDPDVAAVYIVPLNTKSNDALNDRNNLYNRGDNINQGIADKNDKDLSRNRYVVWTDKYNFLADGNGNVLNPETGAPWSGYTEEDISNPIGRLPFVDVSDEKLFGYWVGHGSSLTDFTITFGCILSDMGEIVKLQGYSQPVISSTEEPKTISVGPHRVLWLKKDKKLEADMNPTFEFATPSPDIDGSLNFIENVLRMFLTSRGTDSRLVSSKEQKDYSSGFERLLAMIDRSEATVEDKILFDRVEREIFSLIVDWNNYLQENKQDYISDDLKGVKLSEDIVLNVSFVEPMQVETKSEKEDSAIKRMEAGLASKLMAIMELYSLDKEAAQELLEEIEMEVTPSSKTDSGGAGEVEEIDEADDSDLEDVGSADKDKTETGGGAVPSNNDVNVQKTALNGAQVASLIQIVQSVATGNLPRDSGIAMIEAAFGYDTATAVDIMDRSGNGFKPSGATVPTSVSTKTTGA